MAAAGRTSDVIAHRFDSAEPLFHHAYVGDAVCTLIGSHPARVFDIGCGNGAFARKLAALGHEVTGIDPSVEGIRQARIANPGLRFEEGNAYEPLAERFGTFDVVISLEVIGHLLWPKRFMETCSTLLEPGGKLILSTPFHGYWKNLALAALGKFDAHVNPLRDNGPYKFWSERTLRQLLESGGFGRIQFHRAGRVPALAKSVIAVATKL